MDVRELAPGLWRWTAPHPEWEPGARWPRDVGCLYVEDEQAVTLIDPLVPQADRDAFLRYLDRDVERAERPVHVLQTVGWHERSIPELVERYGAETALPATIETRALDGIEFPEARETVYWLREHAALVPGDSLLGADGGLSVCPPDWIARAASYPQDFAASLRRLLELPVEAVLVSHGEPVLTGGREALEQALEAAGPTA